MSVDLVLLEIANERRRQDALKAAGKFTKTCADSMTDPERLAVLAEEFGEVGRAVCEGLGGNSERGRTELRTELVQVAAVCVAWCEGLDRQSEGP